MPVLQIQHVNGQVETRELSRTQPLTIGRQSFNDVCVPDDDVAAMHCRILWNKTAFEVTAASAQGVEVNGTSVAHVRLNSGDVIRVGSLDLVYADETAESEDPIFAAVPETPPRRPAETASRSSGPSASSPRDRNSSREEARPRHTSESAGGTAKAEQRPLEDLSLFEGPVLTESQTLDAHDDQESSPKTSTGRKSPPPRQASMSMAGTRRPGEQDALRSPLVLGLGLGALILMLVAGVFWFLIGREQATRLYDRAVAELNEGQYAQSIASFEQFLTQYPNHTYRQQAERGQGRALVQKEIAGATPAWAAGLEQVQKLITSQRNEPNFADLQPILARFGEEIALGSARTAATIRDPALLTTSEDAQVILERYSDPTAPPSAAIARIKEARSAAVIAISKQKLFDDGMAAVDAGLKSNQPMVALAEREKLVQAYEGFAAHPRVKEALQKALDLEQSVITSDETERPAETTELPAAYGTPLQAVFLTRTRTDESSVGQVALTQSKDCTYAVDTITGELVWRRVTGLDRPFFPFKAQASRSVVILYDGYQKSLICCDARSGQLVWRLALESAPRSAPLLHESQLYLPLGNQTLCRIDLESGRLTERLRFSQNVHGPPVLSADGNHLLIPGEMAMIYALSMRPLKAQATTFTDHAAGALSAPATALGKLLLLCENDRSDSARLRLWNAADPRRPLVELTGQNHRVTGAVREPPVLRGNQLMVPSSGERLAAFTVSDEPDRMGLTPVATYRLHDEDPQRGAPPAEAPTPRRPIPMYVTLGADRQFWVASSAFRRLEIEANSIHLDPNTAAAGIAAQPLQVSGEQFFVGRRQAFHDGVIFSAVDRERMLSPWRTVVGTRWLEVTAARGGGVVGVNEAGQVILLSPERLVQGGIDQKSNVELELPAGVTSPLVTTTLHDGRIFLAANGEVPAVWVIGSGGQLDLATKLPADQRVEAGAALLDEGLVVPVSGRLKFVALGSGRKAVQDWIAPVGDQAPAAWHSLLRLDATELLACRRDGLLLRIPLRTADVPHLAEAARIALGAAVDLAPRRQGDVIVVADAANVLHRLNWRTFDNEGKRQFPAAIRGLWEAAAGWLVWSDDHLRLLADDRDLTLRWTADLKALELAGAPRAENGRLLLAARDGTIAVLDLATGAESRRIRVPQALSHGLQQWDGKWWAIAIDGAVYGIDAQLKP